MTCNAFGDARKDDVCAAVYSVVHQSSGISQGLLCSKSRLSKQDLKISRLELVACHVPVNLLGNAKKALTNYPIDKLFAWTDSKTTLHWIRGNGNYKQFVKNRADKIREKKKKKKGLACVNTAKNPADIGSCSMSVRKMREL